MTDHTPDPKDRNGRVARSKAPLQRALLRLTSETPTPPQGSPIATLLRDHEDEIRDALRRGWTPGAIARVLADEHVEFAPESIRLRIRAMFVAPSTRRRSDKPTSDRTADGIAAASRPSVHRSTVLTAPVTRATPESPSSRMAVVAADTASVTHLGLMEDPK